MPCRNSSGNVASDASSTPSARSPFQVKATVTQRLSGGCASDSAAPRPTLSSSPASQRGPVDASRKERNVVARRQRRRARQQEVLDVVEFEHVASSSDHCIRSSMLENASLSVSAFLTSSALT